MVNLRRTTLARHLSAEDVLTVLATAEQAIGGYSTAAPNPAAAEHEPKFLADIIRALNNGNPRDGPRPGGTNAGTACGT